MNHLRYRKLRLWIRRHGTALCWAAIALGAAATVVLGVIGFQQNAQAQEPPAHYTISTLLYLACQLFLVNSGGVQGPVSWELDVAGFAGGLVMASTVIGLISSLFHEKWKDLRLRLCHGHVVVCGLDRKGRKLAEEFLLADNRKQSARKTKSEAPDVGESLPVVVIERNAANDNLRSMADLGAEVIVADAADEHILQKAGVHRARYLVAATPNDDTNIRIAAIARKLTAELRPDSEPLRCRIHVTGTRLLDLLTGENAPNDCQCEIRAFNMFVNSARLLFDDGFLDPGLIRANDRRTVHPVIVGLGQMGEALLIQAARTAQFANLRKLRVTVIDLDARRRQNLLLSRYPNLPLCCDLCFLDGDVHDATIRNQLENWAQDDAQVLRVAVCLDDDHRAMNCAMHLPKALAERKVPVYVRLSEPHGFGSLLKGQPTGPMGQFHCFGAPEDVCPLDRVFRPGIEELARAIHTAYLDDESKKSPPPQPSPTLRPWEELSEHYKNSNREQAKHIAWKLAAVGCRKVRKEQCRGESVNQFTDDEIEILAKMEHLRWCAEKWLDGWQKGPSKDPDQRTHPNLVPWEELSEDDRNKDRDPIRNIPSLVERSGCVIERITVS